MIFFQRIIRIFRIGKAFKDVKASTDDEKKLRAQKLLLEILGQSQGIPTKIGQFLSMNDDGNELQDALDASITPMPFDEVEQILNKEFNGNYRTVFKKVKPEGLAASLGQVHFGTLKTGQAVAIKVQYLGVFETVENELKVLGWLPNMGPMKKWGMDVGGFIKEFRQHLLAELDYKHEASQQMQYREALHDAQSDSPDVIVPEVYPEYSNEHVLVQSLEKGDSMEDAVKLPQNKRQEIGRIWVRHLLYMLFQKGVMHSDPNPRNFAFRTKSTRSALVLYDFGSLFEVSMEERMILLRIILAIREREDLDPAQCLKGLGFDLEKLSDIRTSLPGLLAVLFEPFTQDCPFDIDEWELNKRWDAIVGELKWWFRSAAPTRIIFLMRTFHGLASHLGKLNVSISWSNLLDEVAGDLYVEARNWPLPECDLASVGTNFQGLSEFLKIDVKKSNGNRVTLTMPARVVENLEEVIDPPVLESIRKQNIDLNEILLKVQRSGFVAQTLLELNDSERTLKVWLE